VQRYWQYGTEPTLLLAGKEGQETGYAVLASRPHRGATGLYEMRALDARIEEELLRAAAHWAQVHGHDTLYLSFVPQHATTAHLERLGDIEEEWNEGLMLRSITLSTEEMARVRDAYISGAACIWWADDF
jgi:hypothetical protein